MTFVSETATKNWYIVHTYSGFENKVKESLEERVKAYGLQDKVGDVLIPTYNLVSWMPLSLHFDLKEAFGLPDGVVSANEIAFHAPVRLGDRITTTQRIRDISDEKKTRVGTGRFWTIDVSYHDQDGELKGVETYEMFSYSRGAPPPDCPPES